MIGVEVSVVIYYVIEHNGNGARGDFGMELPIFLLVDLEGGVHFQEALVLLLISLMPSGMIRTVLV